MVGEHLPSAAFVTVDEQVEPNTLIERGKPLSRAYQACRRLPIFVRRAIIGLLEHDPAKCDQPPD